LKTHVLNKGEEALYWGDMVRQSAAQTYGKPLADSTSAREVHLRIGVELDKDVCHERGRTLQPVKIIKFVPHRGKTQ
jgi:hypothetical protein